MPESDRLRVLRLLESGTISAEQAADLLNALGAGRQGAANAMAARTLRIRVFAPDNGPVESIELPLETARIAARAGLGLSGLLPAPLGGLKIANALRIIEAGRAGEVLRWIDHGGTGIEISLTT